MSAPKESDSAMEVEVAAGSSSSVKVPVEINNSISTGKAVMATAGTIPSVTVSLHPLVIMNVSEHWTRRRAQEGSPQQGNKETTLHTYLHTSKNTLIQMFNFTLISSFFLDSFLSFIDFCMMIVFMKFLKFLNTKCTLYAIMYIMLEVWYRTLSIIFQLLEH